MVLLDYTEYLIIIYDPLYAKRVVLHIDTSEFVLDNTELTLLFIQLKKVIGSRNYSFYITHIRYHTG